jgi:hypothetical protein
VATVLTITALLGVFFRAPDLAIAFEYALHIPTQLLSAPTGLPDNTAAFLGALVGMEYMNRETPRRPLHLPWLPIRWAAYMVLAYLIVDRFNAREAFIYFQF